MSKEEASLLAFLRCGGLYVRKKLDHFVNYMSHMIQWNDIAWQREMIHGTLFKNYDDVS
ncbi:hypothetical protein GHH_c07090 [Geobacillus sp. GHH01]|nr:hypothetical protein GHH_c07090 [Geobacillus sp. GHH01]WJQ07844.1 hypothetical protein QT235_04190 [Geobacillus stearothermophilus]